MSSYLKEPYESAVTEAVTVLKHVWQDRKVYAFIGMWPMALMLFALGLAMSGMSPDLKTVNVSFFFWQIASALFTVLAITLAEVRVYRYMALDEGRDAVRPAPIRFNKRIMTYAQYKFLLTIPGIAIPYMLPVGFGMLAFMLGYHLFVLRLTFLFTSISLDREISVGRVWKEISPVFTKLIFVELVFAGIVVLAAFPVAALLSAIVGKGAIAILPLLGGILRVVFIIILAVVDMRFYWRAVLKNERPL